MKTAVLLLGIMSLSIASHAQKNCLQKHKGQVLLHTDKGDGVPNIAIVIDGVQGQLTDQNGMFFFSLSECPGISVQLKLNNPAYGIVNHVEMARYTLQQLDRPAQFQFTVIITTKKELETDRIAYYSAIAGVAIDKGISLQKGKIAELEALLKQQGQKNDRLIDSLATLRAQYAQALKEQANRPKEIEEVAKLFAKQIQIDSSYQKAFGFYKVGKFSEALKALPDEQMQDEKQRFQAKLTLARRIEQEGQKERDNYISKSLFKAFIYRNLGNIKKTLEWYREAVSADSTQIKNIIRLAYFLQAQHTAHEPERWYRKALSLNPTDEQKVIILNHLGLFYTDNNQIKEAKAAFLQAKQIQEWLVQKDPDQYEPGLAAILNNLGLFFYRVNNRSEAEAPLLQANQIYQRLLGKNPDQYLPDLATNLNNLGLLYKANKQVKEAKAAYLQAKQIQEWLVQKEPDQYEPDLARTLLNLGLFFYGVNNWGEAETPLLQAKEIYQRLLEKNSDQYEPGLAKTFNSLGIFYAYNKREKEAEVELLQAKQHLEHLVEKNPGQYEQNLAITLSNLNIIYKANNRK